MAQEIVRWCDHDLTANDKRVPARLVVVAIDGRAPVSLDLCDDCREVFVTPIEKLLADHGQFIDPESIPTPPKSDQPSTKIACPLGCGVRLARTSFRGHFRTAHGRELADVEAELGHAVDGKPLAHPCPECGQGFTSAQGAATHLWSVHGKRLDGSPANLSEPEPTPPRKQATKSTTATKRAPRKRNR